MQGVFIAGKPDYTALIGNHGIVPYFTITDISITYSYNMSSFLFLISQNRDVSESKAGTFLKPIGDVSP